MNARSLIATSPRALTIESLSTIAPSRQKNNMNTLKKCLSALAISAALTTTAQAVPVVLDFTGTVAQRSFWDFATGVQTWDPTSSGAAWSARFVIESDAFGPVISNVSEYGRQAYYSGLPGAVTASLTIGGMPVDVAQFNTDTSTLRALDSAGVLIRPDGWAIAPDQWGVSLRSMEVTSAGTAAASDLRMSIVEDFLYADETRGTSMFSLDDVASPLALLMLPFENPLWSRDVFYSVDNFSCGQTCVGVGRDLWSLRTSTVTRTVGSTAVPEPGMMALLLAGLAGVFALRRRRVLPASTLASQPA